MFLETQGKIQEGKCEELKKAIYIYGPKKVANYKETFRLLITIYLTNA